MTDQAKIVSRKLSYYYRKVTALHEIDLEIRPNQVYALLGPARSGRTTFLRVLNRLNDLVAGTRMEGEVLLDGVNIYGRDVNVTGLRRKVGMVFEVPAPLPMSIFDNIAYGPRLNGITNKSNLEQTVEEALKMAVLWDEVKDRLNNSATRLSGGQQQRLCIARVLALAPEVILLDQPCSGLDPVSTAKIEESLTRLKERFTIIIAPHNVQQAGRVADRIAFLLMGKVIEQGSVADIFTNPREQQTADYISGRFG